jgi:hypothetical protein
LIDYDDEYHAVRAQLKEIDKIATKTALYIKNSTPELVVYDDGGYTLETCMHIISHIPMHHLEYMYEHLDHDFWDDFVEEYKLGIRQTYEDRLIQEVILR